MSTTTTTVPGRLAGRPRDKRGFVIAYVQFIGANGEPDFRVIDDARAARCLHDRLCAMCGTPMTHGHYFIGGPKCVEHGVFYDPPMHRDCAVFAMQTCPHLARSKGRYSEPDVRVDMEGAHLIVGDMDVQKAEWFGLMRTSRYTYGRQPSGMLTIHAKLPWLSVERWRDGARL